MSKVWAFLISVAECDNKENSLSFVHKDNKYMKKGLVDGLLIPENRVIICDKDGYIKYSDFQNILLSYSKIISVEDRIIVYFSGHGGGTPFSLLFSDQSVPFSLLCDEIDAVPACAKIFIIDSCYSGNSEVPEVPAINPSHNLFDYARSGYAVFASSNDGSISSRHPEEEVSLYTYCLSNALCSARIRNGKISLLDVARCVSREVDYIAKKYGRPLQHPIFRSHIPGDLLFQITEETNKSQNIYSLCDENYDIYETRILHSSIEMRYSVFAIAKGSINDESIANYTMQIVQKLSPVKEFITPQQARRFQGERLKVVFVYWGMSEEDIIRRNWIYRSTWADLSSNRDNWYRLNKNSRIVSDVWVNIEQQYNATTQLWRKFAVSNEDLINQTHLVVDVLLVAANEVVKIFEEYDNGEIPECAFIQASKEHFKLIESCYWQMSRLPLSSAELKEWADHYDCLAASIDNMRLFYTSTEFLSREENNRKMCMRGAIRTYREDLQQLIRIEQGLKEEGILAPHTINKSPFRTQDL